jgi:carbonic anhydrase/acetyltransferase-like protein (isoleucine patch superfamily)
MERSIIAEGAVVKQNQVIPAGVVAAGNPAKVIREIRKKDEELWSRGKQIYIDLAKRYLKSPMTPVKMKGIKND